MGMWVCWNCREAAEFSVRGFTSKEGKVICKKCKAEEIRKELNKE